MPRVFVTGATSGIGRATALRLAQGGYDILICGRRTDRLEQLATEIRALGREVHALTLDVADSAAVIAALSNLPAPWQQLDLLVNNAGLARGLGPIDQGLLSDWEEMIDTNLKGVLYVSRIVAGWMRAAGRGHIILVGSTAGKETYPNGNVYAATKHAIDALARGMRMDLVAAGVKVSAIHPGFVETEFSEVRFHGDATRAKSVYQGFQPLSGADVAEVIHYMAAAPAHVNLADVVLMPTAQASAMVVHRQS
jgi:3-hydroxy acid dehydrogenase / malonic semialdehyde reductase